MRQSSVIVRSVPVAIRGLPSALQGLRIAQVTDFHFRRWEPVYEVAQSLLLEEAFDLVVATGDFSTQPSGWRRAAGLTNRFFGPVAEQRPCYAVLGNHDHPGMASNGVTPLRFLCNESIRIAHRGGELVLAGVDQSRRNRENLGAALDNVTNGDVCVLLAHSPSTVFRLPRHRVALQLSGHTHGGQIRLPWLGCVWSHDRISRRMAHGLHWASEVALHTSAGIGVSMPIPFRINCPAEVVILTLHA
ncbi:MAG: metallophosphoesterase [Phycisphaerae bacterium]|jgi:predicted MPP superfamily phosphohydrolase